MSVYTPGTREWLRDIACQIDDATPRLLAVSQAVAAPHYPVSALLRVTEFLASGWTLDRLDAALIRAREHTRKGSTRARVSWFHDEILNMLVPFAHLTPDEFDAWSNLFAHDLFAMSDAEAQEALTVWRACVPLPLAAACVTAGLTPAEATALHAAGNLTLDTVQTLTALREHKSSPQVT